MTPSTAFTSYDVYNGPLPTGEVPIGRFLAHGVQISVVLDVMHDYLLYCMIV